MKHQASRTKSSPEPEHSRAVRLTVAVLRSAIVVTLAIASAACATVRPEQRATLADPTMQFDSEGSEDAARQHVLDNREGSFGAGSVEGGGCGCN